MDTGLCQDKGGVVAAMNMRSLFALLKQYYPLDEAYKLGNCANLFETWNADCGKITQYKLTMQLSMQKVLLYAIKR